MPLETTWEDLHDQEETECMFKDSQDSESWEQYSYFRININPELKWIWLQNYSFQKNKEQNRGKIIVSSNVSVLRTAAVGIDERNWLKSTIIAKC